MNPPEDTAAPPIPVGPDPVELDGPEPAPPKRSRSRRKSSSTPTKRSSGGRPSNSTKRAQKVATLHRTASKVFRVLGVVSPSLRLLASALDEQADDLGAAWSEWADTSERVAGWIDGASVGGGAVSVAMAYGELGITVQAIAAAEAAAADTPPPSAGGRTAGTPDLLAKFRNLRAADDADAASSA